MSFFTVTGCGPRTAAPGLQTNSVWTESLRSPSFLLCPPPPPYPTQQPRLREMALARGVAGTRRRGTDSPLAARERAAAERDRRAETEM